MAEIHDNYKRLEIPAGLTLHEAADEIGRLTSLLDRQKAAYDNERAIDEQAFERQRVTVKMLMDDKAALMSDNANMQNNVVMPLRRQVDALEAERDKLRKRVAVLQDLLVEIAAAKFLWEAHFIAAIALKGMTPKPKAPIDP